MVSEIQTLTNLIEIVVDTSLIHSIFPIEEI